MSLDVTYTSDSLWGGGEPGLKMVTGYVHANGSTSGDISGLTKFLRHMYAWTFTPRQNIGTAQYNVVKTFDTTNDCDKLTITCTDTNYFDFMIIGQASGS